MTPPRRHANVALPLGTALLLSAALTLAGLAGLAVATPAGADPAATYYLAIGASESVGVQPTPAHPHGVPTDQGYANDLAAAERSHWPGLQLVQVGCPGETAVIAVDGGGRCHSPEGSQLATAVAFLRAHAPATVLATVDLGFNDVRPCLAHQTVDQGCVATALAQIQQVLPGALSQLQAVGGPALHIVGLEHNDPYLGDYIDGPAGQAFAIASVPVIGELNATLGDVYVDAGIPVADVPRAFDTDDQRPTHLAGYGTVPTDVAKVCTLTWMCAPAPYTHNVHPNAQGYQVIADAVADAMGTGIDPTPPAAS